MLKTIFNQLESMTVNFKTELSSIFLALCVCVFCFVVFCFWLLLLLFLFEAFVTMLGYTTQYESPLIQLKFVGLFGFWSHIGILNNTLPFSFPNEHSSCSIFSIIMG